MTTLRLLHAKTNNKTRSRDEGGVLFVIWTYAQAGNLRYSSTDVKSASRKRMKPRGISVYPILYPLKIRVDRPIA